MINASIDGDNVVYKKDVNLGIAVALDNGLIVPVVKDAGEKNLLGLSRAIADVADRARAKKLNPEEVQGGTFTITNPGNFGAQFGLPIINQPQVAILGVGTIEKRPVVIDDMIGIRLKGYLTLGYDHRLVDGAVADQFMADLKAYSRGSTAGRSRGWGWGWGLGIGDLGTARRRVEPGTRDCRAAYGACGSLGRRALRRGAGAAAGAGRAAQGGRDSRHAAAAAASARAHLGVKGDGGRAHILAAGAAARRSASRFTRPAAAAT